MPSKEEKQVPVTCALYFAQRFLCFGPSFMRPESTHPLDVHPETPHEITMVLFYLQIAAAARADLYKPEYQTPTALQYGKNNLFLNITAPENNIRREILLQENKAFTEIRRQFSLGKTQ